MRAKYAPLMLASAALLAQGCASHTKLHGDAMAAVGTEQAGRRVVLRQSSFYGDLYDDNEKWLLSPRNFGDVHHINDLDGEPVRPQNPRGIIPAGAEFIVEKVEFPVWSAMAGRMLTTPRYSPWVYLRPVNRTLFEQDRRVVLVLPMNMPDKQSVDKEIRNLLAEPGSFADWLAGRRPTIQAAIKHKEAVSGMSIDEMIAALGEPTKWYRESNGIEVAWYGGDEVWMRDERVVEVRSGRRLASR